MPRQFSNRPGLLRLALCWLAALCGALAAADCRALEFQRSLWGFEGNKVVRHAFNPFTIEVFNPEPKMAEGVIVLQQTVGIGPVDIPISQAVAIEPGGRRVLQFVVYLDESLPDLSLQFRPKEGRPEKPALVDAPGLHRGALIYLREAQRIAPPVNKVPAFDEASFPTSVVGTSGLSAVVLDHVPDWDEFRQQAFLDWLQEGGTLHLLARPTGGIVPFTGTLAALNDPSTDFSIGGGRVIRHEDVRSVQGNDIFQHHPDLASDRFGSNNGGDYYGSFGPQIYANLRSMSRPEHQWGLIWLLAFVYLLVIFPGCWLVGGRKADYRVTYGLILGAVFLFSTAFKWIGKRGYGEQMTMSAIAVAHDLGGGRFDVTQWNSLFVTEGGMYTVKHGTEGTVYGAGNSDDAVRGMATNRPGSEFETEVPPFSSRTFVYGGVARAPETGFQITNLDAVGGKNLRSLVFTVSEEMAKTLKPGGYVIWGNKASTLNLSRNKIVMSSSSSDLDKTFGGRGYYGYNYDNSGKSSEALLDECLTPAIMLDLGIQNHRPVDEFAPPAGTARIYLPAEMPKEFNAKFDSDILQRGRVIYRFDIRIDQPAK